MSTLGGPGVTLLTTSMIAVVDFVEQGAKMAGAFQPAPRHASHRRRLLVKDSVSIVRVRRSLPSYHQFGIVRTPRSPHLFLCVRDVLCAM